MYSLWTLGHSTLPLADFIALIRGDGIEAIADVRSIPFSTRQNHYSSPNLGRLLESAGIRYVFLGGHVGGRPRYSNLFTATGRADFTAMSATAWFIQGLDRIQTGLDRMPIGLMCGEEDPLPCHRCLLIAPALKARGIIAQHLRKGGQVETQEMLEARMLESAGMSAIQPDLFLTGAEGGPDRLGLAREILADKYAWRINPDDSSGDFENPERAG